MGQKNEVLSAMAFQTEFFANLFREIRLQGGDMNSFYQAAKDPEFIKKAAKTIVAGNPERYFTGNNFLAWINRAEDIEYDFLNENSSFSIDERIECHDSHLLEEEHKSRLTYPISYDVYQLLSGGNSSGYVSLDDAFKSVGVSLDRLCLTQAQIIDFVVNHSEWLANGFTTFFLFKQECGYFIAKAHKDKSIDISWLTDYQYETFDEFYRVVLPKIRIETL